MPLLTVSQPYYRKFPQDIPQLRDAMAHPCGHRGFEFVESPFSQYVYRFVWFLRLSALEVLEYTECQSRLRAGESRSYDEGSECLSLLLCQRYF